MALTEKRKLFADEYLIDLNASRAYQSAYQRVKNSDVAAAAASRLLKDADVKQYISEQMEELHDEKTADAQEVLEYLTSVLRGSEEITKDRLKAAELLGKRYSLFRDRVEVSGLEEEKSKLDDLINQMRGG